MNGFSTNNILGALGGGLVGLNYQMDNTPGNYYVKANYKGNGLADTGIGYMANQRYQNPYDQSTLLSSMLGQGSNILGSLGNLGNLSSSNLSPYDLQGNFKDNNWMNSAYELPTKEFDLSWLGNTLGSIGGSKSSSSFDYSLPTKDFNFNTSWFKK